MQIGVSIKNNMVNSVDSDEAVRYTACTLFVHVSVLVCQVERVKGSEYTRLISVIMRVCFWQEKQLS